MFEGRRVLWVAGGRDYDDVQFMDAALAKYMDRHWILITGSARGADLMAESLWKDNQLPYVGIPARWAEYGKRAGFLRNQFITDQQPDKLLVFPGGKGTFNAVNEARHRRIEVEYAEKEAE